MNIRFSTGSYARRTAWREQLPEVAAVLDFAPIPIGQDENFHVRFAHYYQRLCGLPRRVRRAFGRKLPVSLAGAALLLALGQGQALAATITVDGASCTLVDAIDAANNDTSPGGCTAGNGPDTIELLTDVTLSGVNNSTYGDTGLPVIASAITVTGNDFTIARDGGAPPFRLMAVGADGNLTLNNVTLSGGATTGYQNGGGLFNYYGEVAIVDSTVSGNSSSNDGGGVFNQYGKVTLTHGTVSGNVAGRYGGGLSNNGEYYSQAGEIILTNATVSGNTANSDAGGVDNVNGELKLTNSTVTGNSAVYYSGGLSNLYGTVTLNGSLISGNVASQAAEINNFSFLFGPPGPVYADNYNLFGHGGLDNAAAFYGFIPGATDIDATSEGTNTPLADILDISLADNDGPTETHALVAGSPAWTKFLRTEVAPAVRPPTRTATPWLTINGANLGPRTPIATLALSNSTPHRPALSWATPDSPSLPEPTYPQVRNCLQFAAMEPWC